MTSLQVGGRGSHCWYLWADCSLRRGCG